MSFRRLGRVLALIMLVGSGAVQAESVPSNWIRSVTVSGLTHLNIVQDLKTVSFNSRVGQYFNPSECVLDVNQLYLTGYFSSVDYRVTRSAAGVWIEYLVVENPVISAIVVTGNVSFSSADLMALMKSQTGKPLNLKTVDEDRRRIEQFYETLGYSLFSVVGIALQPDRTLWVRINEGMIEQVTVSGLNRLPEFVVRRELLSVPDSVFNQKIIQRDRSKLLRLGYFNEVGIPQLDHSDNGVNIRFQLSEKKVNLIDLGLETDDQEFVGYVQGRLNHVFQVSDVMSAKTQVGLEGRQLRAKSYSLRYFQPWLLNRWPVQWSVDAWTDEQVDLGGGQTVGNRQGWDTVFRIPIFAETWALSTGLKSEVVRPNSMPTFKVNSVSGRLTYESEAHLENTESGSYGFLEYQKTLNIAAFNWEGLSYSKYSLQLAHFIPLSPSTVLGMNTNLAYYNTAFADDPAFQIIAFRMGGSNSLRGYPEGGISGLKHVLLNLEYRFTLSPSFQGVVFSDWGNVYAQDEPIDWHQLQSSYGLGVRFQTPVGDIRSDLAWGKNFVIHLNIGQMF